MHACTSFQLQSVLPACTLLSRCTAAAAVAAAAATSFLLFVFPPSLPSVCLLLYSLLVLSFFLSRLYFSFRLVVSSPHSSFSPSRSLHSLKTLALVCPPNCTDDVVKWLIRCPAKALLFERVGSNPTVIGPYIFACR